MAGGLATFERREASLWQQLRTARRELEAPQAPRKRHALDLAAELGIVLDPWQRAAITTDRHDILMLVTRQGGKGEVMTLLALDKVLNDPGSTVVVVSRAERQAKRLLRRIKRRYRQLNNVSPAITDSTYALELRNGSEILAIPGSEETTRGIEAVDLLLIDEAALVPDELAYALFPMLATTDGRAVAATTARGRRGWFWKEWEEGGDEWHRARITWKDIPRFKAEWIARTRRRLGEFMFRQEFECEFLDDVTQLFSSELVMAAKSDEVKSRGLPRLSA
jgi:hypothetical protein